MILSSTGRRDDPLPLSLARASLPQLHGCYSLHVSDWPAYFYYGFSKVAEQATAHKIGNKYL